MPEQTLQTRRLIIALCAAMFALGQFHRAAGSIFAPILIDRFSVSATMISGLVSIMFLAAVLTQLPLGAALDRYGPRLMMSCSVTVVALGTALFAVGQSYEALFAARIIIGFGMASLGASIHVLVARSFSPREFGYVNGMVITLGSVGGILGTYPLALALARYDWATVFGAAATGAVALVLAILSIVPSAPAKPQQAPDDQPGTYLDLLGLSEVRKILALGLVTFAPMTTITGLWGGPFLMDVHEFSAEDAGAVLLAMFAGSVVAAFLFGHLDRSISRRKAMILTAAVTSTTCLSLLAFLPTPGPLVSSALLLVVVFCQTFYIPLGAHMRKVVPMQLVGRASILLSLVGVAAIPAMQTGFGAILDLARAAGVDAADQYRFSFGAMALVMAICITRYATASQADDA
ncbi:MAG: MFS transporter [Pseudomonadota bacterium]